MLKPAHKTKAIIIIFFVLEFLTIATLANTLFAEAKNRIDTRTMAGNWRNSTRQASTNIVSSGTAALIATSTVIASATSSPNTNNTGATPQRLLWGAFVGNNKADLDSFEKLVGQPVDLQGYFVGWNDDFPSSIAANLKPANKTLVIYWEQYGVTLDNIISGKSDVYINKFAADAKSSGVSIILAPFHEMNGNWDPWDGTVGSNTPAKIIAAWRHLHDAFAGVSNVKFGWAVNNVSVPDTSKNAIPLYYPGDDYVDYVGVDGFNFANPWQSFAEVFDPAMAELVKYQKPIFIFSMSSAPGKEKAAWIKEGLGSKIHDYPKLMGWIWFNHQDEANWLVNSDSASLQAFKDILP
jgi:hypothetical protein